MFSGLAAHGSKPNQSPRPRCNAYLAYNRPLVDRSLRPRVSPYPLNVGPVELDDSVVDGALLRLAAAEAA